MGVIWRHHFDFRPDGPSLRTDWTMADAPNSSPSTYRSRRLSPRSIGARMSVRYEKSVAATQRAGRDGVPYFGARKQPPLRGRHAILLLSSVLSIISRSSGA